MSRDLLLFTYCNNAIIAGGTPPRPLGGGSEAPFLLAKSIVLNEYFV